MNKCSIGLHKWGNWKTIKIIDINEKLWNGEKWVLYNKGIDVIQIRKCKTCEMEKIRQNKQTIMF